MERVVVYARISSDREGSGLGVDRQLEDCRALARREQLTVVEELVDNNTSAFRQRRTKGKWRELVELVERGDVDGIVVYATDRLYRHPVDLEEIIGLVEGHRLTIHAVTGGRLDLNRTDGRLAARILASTARDEVERKAERQARAAREKAEEGRWNGGRRPLGYRRSKQGKRNKLTLHPVEAPALREAARMFLTDGNLARAARYFSEATDYPGGDRPKRQWRDPKVPEPRGYDMPTRVLRDALYSARIAGLREYWPAEERRAHEARQQRAARTGTPPPERTRRETLREAEWPGIVPVEEWLAIRRKLDDPRRRARQERPVLSLLGGVLRCGNPDCGSNLGHSSTTYKCSGVKGACGKVSVSTPAIERYVAELVRARLEATPEALGEEETEPETDTERRRRELQQQFDRLLPLFKAGVVTAQELTDERRQLQLDLARLDEQDADRARRAVQRQRARVTVEEWDAAGQEERGAILRALIDRVVVAPSPQRNRSGSRFRHERVTVHWAR